MKTKLLIKNEYIYVTENEIDKVYRCIMVDNILKLIEIKDEKIDEFKIDKGVINNIKDKDIKDNSSVYMSNFRIVMINSDYTLGFNIDRAKLHAILKKKYNIQKILFMTT